MNIKFFLLLICVSFRPVFAQDCSELKEIISIINEKHFSPPAFDETQAKNSIDEIFNQLDPYQLVFLQSDIDEAKLKADGFFEEDNFCLFIEHLAKILVQRLDEAEMICENFDTDWLSDYANEKILFSDESSFALNASEQTKNWEKWAVYKYNATRFRFSKSKEADNNEALMELYSDKMNCFFNSFYLGEENNSNKMITSVCFNSILFTCDPHSYYFTNDMYNTFDIGLSKDYESFGFSVYTNEIDELLIKKIAFNSPAFYTNEIKKNDKILSIVWADKKLDNLICSDEYSINERLLRPEETNIKLVLKNEEDEIIEVSLQKSSIANEVNSVNGYVLNGAKKVAYLALPSFYQSGPSSNYGCANDIAKELVHLKKEGIQGLIFDLRNNGGGSVQEAIELSGIFINEGPLLIDSSSTYDKLVVLKDINRGLIYSGPMLVLVNGNSASASEMFASVMQNYNRALIVGSSTYGKATAQSMEEIGKEGMVKITEFQLCDLKGNSYQKKGIVPNIKFSMEVFDMEKEGDEPYALDAISVVKKTYYTPLSSHPSELLNQKSTERIELSQDFALLNSYVRRLNVAFSDNEEISLNYNQFKANQKENKALLDEYRSLKFEHDFYKVSIHNYMKDMLDLELNRKSSIEEEKEDILNDILIQESYNILLDLINLR